MSKTRKVSPIRVCLKKGFKRARLTMIFFLGRLFHSLGTLASKALSPFLFRQPLEQKTELCLRISKYVSERIVLG